MPLRDVSRDAMADEPSWVSDIVERAALEAGEAAARLRFTELGRCVARIENAVRGEAATCH